MEDKMKSLKAQIISMLIVLLLSCSNSKSEENMTFRGDIQRTGVYNTQSIVSTPTLKWKFKSNKYIESSPAISKDYVFFASGDHNVYALDNKIGKLLWNFETGDNSDCSPALNDGFLYFGDGDGCFHSFDAKTGIEIWKYKTDNQIDSSPAINDGVAYFGSGGNLYAIDIESGNEKWNFQTGNNIDSSPAISENLVLIGDDSSNLYAIQIDTGQKKWVFNTGEKFIEPNPSISNNIVYFGCGKKIYAVEITTGKEKWSYELEYYIRSYVTIKDNYIYFSAGDRYEEILFAFDTNSLQVKWQNKTMDITSSPIVGGKNIYIGCKDGLYALDIDSGKILWKYETEDSIYSSPVLYNKMLVFGCHDGFLYAIE